jgi:hypothetical protein
MDAGDFGAANVVGRALGLIRLPISRRVGEQREQLGEIDHFGDLRLFGGAAGGRNPQSERKSEKSGNGFHFGQRSRAFVLD